MTSLAVNVPSENDRLDRFAAVYATVAGMTIEDARAIGRDAYSNACLLPPGDAALFVAWRIQGGGWED